MAATEAQKAASRRHYHRNAERLSAAANERGKAKWAEMTPEERLEHGRARRARTAPEITRERKQAERDKLRLDVLNAYRPICVCCKTTYEPHLTLDHVGGGGTAERKEKKANMWRIARQEGYPDRFQILCFNCNWAKYHEGECRCQGPLLRVIEGGG